MLLTKEKPKIVNNPGNKFETVLFLPEGENRKGEGGLRTKEYFKHSYKMVDGEWFIVDSDNNPVIPALGDIKSKIKQYLSSNTQYQTPITELPLITVITVVYNGDKYLEETILSVINQTYPNVEYIIIDGGSTDGTLDIIKKYEDYIDYWVSEKDKGIYDAMNKGIDVAMGDYCLFLGADDSLSDGILEQIFTNLSKKYLLIYGNIKYNNGRLVRSKFSFKTYLHNTIHHQAAFYNKKLFNVFRYDLKYKIAADYEMNLLFYLNKSRLESLYIDKVFALCSDNGLSRINFKASHSEMKRIRTQYFNKYQNIFFDLILNIKLFLYQLNRNK